MAKAKPVQGLDGRATTGANARAIARTRLGELYTWAEYVDDPARVEELHNMRIAAKRLRYTLEIFEEALPVALSPIIDELTRVQDELGEIHDSDVRLKLLRLCIGGQVALSERGEEDVEVHEELVEHLLDPDAAASERERRSMESFVHVVRHEREKQYVHFQQHWHRLQERGFREEIQSLLDS